VLVQVILIQLSEEEQILVKLVLKVKKKLHLQAVLQAQQ
jgi:hypothetical protein